eukprot:gnl/MRDRNA2_/MRDRNA2_86624_c0_seq3.p1 gnl/MRDRNA2_/MRDRNA2_86624_c0~~gnl/MRDRNA2_/MRDRNA2_86624_c0_seq3.p1  ORF type:complete len:352 (-),score=58.34 gnl/MRDRNA2_/MRDRNA2_86624_c0_seq3:812-1735(-)
MGVAPGDSQVNAKRNQDAAAGMTDPILIGTPVAIGPSILDDDVDVPSGPQGVPSSSERNFDSTIHPWTLTSSDGSVNAGRASFLADEVCNDDSAAVLIEVAPEPASASSNIASCVAAAQLTQPAHDGESAEEQPEGVSMEAVASADTLNVSGNVAPDATSFMVRNPSDDNEAQSHNFSAAGDVTVCVRFLNGELALRLHATELDGTTVMGLTEQVSRKKHVPYSRLRLLLNEDVLCESTSVTGLGNKVDASGCLNIQAIQLPPAKGPYPTYGESHSDARDPSQIYDNLSSNSNGSRHSFRRETCLNQ